MQKPHTHNSNFEPKTNIAGLPVVRLAPFQPTCIFLKLSVPLARRAFGINYSVNFKAASCTIMLHLLAYSQFPSGFSLFLSSSLIKTTMTLLKLIKPTKNPATNKGQPYYCHSASACSPFFHCLVLWGIRYTAFPRYTLSPFKRTRYSDCRPTLAITPLFPTTPIAVCTNPEELLAKMYQLDPSGVSVGLFLLAFWLLSKLENSTSVDGAVVLKGLASAEDSTPLLSPLAYALAAAKTQFAAFTETLSPGVAKTLFTTAPGIGKLLVTSDSVPAIEPLPFAATSAKAYLLSNTATFTKGTLTTTPEI